MQAFGKQFLTPFGRRLIYIRPRQVRPEYKWPAKIRANIVSAAVILHSGPGGLKPGPGTWDLGLGTWEGRVIRYDNGVRACTTYGVGKFPGKAMTDRRESSRVKARLFRWMAYLVDLSAGKKRVFFFYYYYIVLSALCKYAGETLYVCVHYVFVCEGFVFLRAFEFVFAEVERSV